MCGCSLNQLVISSNVYQNVLVRRLLLLNLLFVSIKHETTEPTMMILIAFLVLIGAVSK